MTRPLVITSVNGTQAVHEFDCGEPARNTWLVTPALANQQNDDTRTYVAVDGTTVLAFHAITVGSILRASLNAAMRRNAPDPVGCVLLAQLAVSTACQQQGLGREMVLHAMRQALKIADLAGCRLFATHPASPDLVPYYEQFGFTLVDATPTLMAMRMSKVRSILDAVGQQASRSPPHQPAPRLP